MPTSNEFVNPDDFELHLQKVFMLKGYDVKRPVSMTQKGYDLELIKDDKRIAVQVKNQRSKINIARIQQFQSYLELPLADRFTDGWFISASGYSNAAIAHINNEAPSNVQLLTYSNAKFVVNYPTTDTYTDPDPEKIRYFGVFTSKGGVGKTTVAAHLAGAFALMGYDVTLLDLDPDKNLRKLFLQDLSDINGDASLFVPPVKKNEKGAVITVLNHDQWDEREHKDVKIIICDCSPVLSENPPELIRKFDYCIIPTTLNPLGIAKNADVIVRTFKHLRQLNASAKMFAVINCYEADRDVAERNRALTAHLKSSIDRYCQADPDCVFVPPNQVNIRRSTSLQYWGYHIINGSKPQLAFKEVGGRSNPRTDFLTLAEYLVENTDVPDVREMEGNRQATNG